MEIDPVLQYVSPSEVNSMEHPAPQNPEPHQNQEAEPGSKKRKLIMLSNGVEIPEPHWSNHKPTTHAGMIKEMYGPKVKLHQRSRGRFKASSRSPYIEANKAIAIREIRHYQKSTSPLIPRSAMSRLIREIVHHIKPDLHISLEAFTALHLSAEPFLVSWFEML